MGPSRIRQFRPLIWTTATFVAIGATRAAIQIALMHLSGATAARFYAVWIGAAAIWIPAMWLATWIWDRGWNRGATIAGLALAGLTISLIEPAWLAVLLPLRGGVTPPVTQRWLVRLDTNLVLFAAIVGASWAVSARRRQERTELESAELNAALAGARLHVLTLQLHPHFLFNALNLISQLAYESVVDAQRILANLRALLVQSLNHAERQSVSLGEELDFLRAYLEIQQRRFGERLDVAFRVAPEALGAQVPPMLLQPIVENSLVHAVAPRAGGGSITIAADVVDARMLISVSDDGPGFRGPLVERVGLRNTRLRLDQMFGGRYALDVRSPKSGGTTTTVTVPVMRASLAPSRILHDPDVTYASPTDEAPSSHANRLPVRVAAFAGWAAVAALWTEWFALNPTSAAPGAGWSKSFMGVAIGVALWLVLTPVVARFARRVDVASGLSLGRAAAHLGIGVVVAVGHTALWLALLSVADPPMYSAILHSSIDYRVWDLFAYGMIVAFTTAATVTQRQRDAAIDVANTRRGLAAAHTAAIRLRLQPGLLLTALDAIARAIATDAEQAEVAIARAGDLLRGLLDRVEVDTHPLADELTLLQSFLDVATPGCGALVRCDDRGLSARELERDVPALVMLSLAAALRGDITGVSVCVDGRLTRVRITASSGDADAERVRALRWRLDAGGRVRDRVAVYSENSNIVAELDLWNPSAERATVPTPTLAARVA
jgi:hypothetical protein